MLEFFISFHAPSFRLASSAVILVVDLVAYEPSQLPHNYDQISDGSLISEIIGLFSLLNVTTASS